MSFNQSFISPLQLSPKYVSELKPLTLDFSLLLATGDTITGVPTLTVSVLQGNDPSPGSLLSGAASISASGVQVIQSLTGGVAATQYLIACQVTTVQGEKLTGQASFWVVAG